MKEMLDSYLVQQINQLIPHIKWLSPLFNGPCSSLTFIKKRQIIFPVKK